MSGRIVLKTRGLTSQDGGVHALEDANLGIRAGAHVAIMGDIGAGKSAFVRQITGVEQRTRRKVRLYGQEVHIAGPLEAREAGIETVFQTLQLADDFDVPGYLFPGREKTFADRLGPFRPPDHRAMRQVMDIFDRIVVFRRGRICANLMKDETDGRDVVV